MNQILLFIGLVIILCLTIKPVGKKLPFPTLLIFIALGMLLGVNGPTHIDFSDYALTETVCSTALLFIMFYGVIVEETEPAPALTPEGNAALVDAKGKRVGAVHELPVRCGDLVFIHLTFLRFGRGEGPNPAVEPLHLPGLPAVKCTNEGDILRIGSIDREADFAYPSVLVFCFFNFRKKAKCFAGDVGSVGIAFILLFLIGRLIIGTGDFSWIVLLSVYGVDSVLTIIHRLMLHENIGLPHRKHLYQIMANELKIPHVMVSSIYMVVQAIIVVGYIMYMDYGYWYLIGTVILLSLIYICFMKKFFRLHQF